MMNFKDISLGYDVFGAYDVLPSLSSCMRNLDRYGDEIRRLTPDLDFLRVVFVRGRRMVLLSVALFEQHMESYGPWIRFLDSFVQIFALYHAVILLPRFFVNTFYVCRHMDTQASDEMDKMRKMCWDMVYDFGWILTGVLTLIAFVGPLAPLALYLTVCTPSYHLLMHTTRFLADYYQGKTFEKNYADLMPLIIRMGVSVCVVSAAVVILISSVNPAVPFIAAAVAVFATVAGRMLLNSIPKQDSKSDHVERSMFVSKSGHKTHEVENTTELVATPDASV